MEHFFSNNGGDAQSFIPISRSFFCTNLFSSIMASLRMIALVAAMASSPSHPQMPGQAAGLVPSDDEEEALDLEPEHYKNKFEWLDQYGHLFGAHAAAADAWPPVPKATLSRKYKLWKNGKNWSAAVGHPPTFETGTEELFCDYIEYANKYGHPVTIVQLIKEARRLAMACGADPAHAGVGSKKWLRGFMKRHQDIWHVYAALLEPARAHAISREAILRYFDLAEIALEGVNAPELVFLMDETYLDMHARGHLKVSVQPSLAPPFDTLHHHPPISTIFSGFLARPRHPCVQAGPPDQKAFLVYNVLLHLL